MDVLSLLLPVARVGPQRLKTPFVGAGHLCYFILAAFFLKPFFIGFFLDTCTVTLTSKRLLWNKKEFPSYLYL